MPRRRLAIPLVPLALAATLAVGGCGEEGDEPASAGTGTGPEGGAETAPRPKDTSTEPEIQRPTGSPPRRLLSRDIVEGHGRPARRGDVLTVHYVGVSFETGEELDSSWDRGQPFEVKLGAGQVIEGWERGLRGMREGGRRKLVIPPELAYGARGSGPIGPNETLVFVVDLLRIR